MFKILASLCSWVKRFVWFLVANPEDKLLLFYRDADLMMIVDDGSSLVVISVKRYLLIFTFIIQPSIYGVIVYFLLCHESLNY